MKPLPRRRFIAGAAFLLAAPALVHAQPGTRRRTIGVVMPSTASSTANLTRAFEQGLQDLGYARGRDLAVEYRYSDGNGGRIGALAEELGRLHAEVVVTTTDAVVRTVARHTGDIPIVMVNASDPVGNGLVKSLAQPGGKITGLTNLSPEITGKRIELLKECIPGLREVVYLWNPEISGAREVFEQVQSAGQHFALRLRSIEVRRSDDIRAALGRLPAGEGHALLAQAPNPDLYTHRGLICTSAIAARLPSIFNRVEYLEAGGLMSYGPNVPEMYRRAAYYVDRILKGAPPASLPVEQPSKFELAINLRTARLLGVEVPQTLLSRANRTVS